jgi:MFS family permease
VTASQAATLSEFQLLFGVIVGFAAGSFYAPLTATTTSWFTRHRSLAVALVSAGIGIGSMTVAPFARWMITNYDWRIAMSAIGALAWLVIIPAAFLVRSPPALPRGAGAAAAGAGGREFTVAQALSTPQICRYRANLFRAARRIRVRSSTWSPMRSIAASRRWPPRR